MRTDTERLVADLNDLLKLDHDAVAAYTIAIENLGNPSYRQSLESYRGDHERHVREISELVTARGGLPMHSPHLLSGPFKLAMQQAGALGGDRGVLLAFRTNERQVRDKYRAFANRAGWPEDIALVLQRGAEDEERHFAWVVQALQELGVTPRSRAGRAERVMEVGQARMADAAEAVESGLSRVANSARQRIGRQLRDRPLRTALTVIGGIVAVTMLGRRR